MSSNDRPTKRFLADYFHDGAWWPISIYAYDSDDAQVRCNKLSLRLLGEHMATIPAVSGGWLPTAICWLRNAFRRA